MPLATARSLVRWSRAVAASSTPCSPGRRPGRLPRRPPRVPLRRASCSVTSTGGPRNRHRAVVVVVWRRFCPPSLRWRDNGWWAVAQPLVVDAGLPDGENRLMVQVRGHDRHVTHASSEFRDGLHQLRVREFQGCTHPSLVAAARAGFWRACWLACTHSLWRDAAAAASFRSSSRRMP